jgi:hypothetical protein
MNSNLNRKQTVKDFFFSFPEIFYLYFTITNTFSFLSIDSSENGLDVFISFQDSPNPHVMDNVHAIMSSAASKFSLSQFELMTG